MTSTIKHLYASKYRLCVSGSELSSKSSYAFREGALLKVCFDDDRVGYADLHPWETLGDLSVDAQLSGFARGQSTKQILKSLEFAKFDADARAQNKSLFAGLKNDIKNHWLMSIPLDQTPDLFADSTANFLSSTRISVIKVKVSPEDWEHKKKYLQALLKKTTLKVRLDFNASFTFDQAKNFLLEWRSCFDLNHLDFIEDPCPWNPKHWSSLSAMGVSLALDREIDTVSSSKHHDCFSCIVFKPAIQSHSLMAEAVESHQKKIYVTSYLDHPIGQAFALFSALRLKQDGAKVDVCGLSSHLSYAPTPYSDRLRIKDAVLSFPEDLGVGFGDLLCQESWQGVF